jgi:serine/threonine-protein kinase
MATCPSCRTRYADDTASCPKDGAHLLPDQAFITADTPLVKGATVGEWRVEDIIAEGGFGTVYKVVHPLIGKSAAIKVLKREYSSNPEMVSRFISEARAVNQIRHKNIIDIFAFGVLDDGRHYFVMELLEGTTLDRFIRNKGRLSPIDAIPILRQLGRALGAAHAAGITHRDLKPENVFLSFDDDGHATPKLLDFGIAKLRSTSEATHRTRDGAPMGTPLYMSPEQVYGKSVDHRSDIYSFGILVHEALTGAPPFDGETVMDVLTAQTSEKPKPVSQLVPSVPPELDSAILCMLEKDPDKRPQSVTLAVDRLLEAAEVSGILPRRSGPTSGVGSAPMIPEAATSLPGQRRSSLSSAATTLAPGDAPSQPPRGSRSKLLIGGLVAAAVVGTIGFVATRGLGGAATAGGATSSPVAGTAGATVAPTPVTTVTPVDTASAATSSSAASQPTAVKVTFEGIPEDTEVLLEGKSLGTTGDGVTVPRKTDKVKLTLRKTGFAPRDVWIVPDRDRAIATDLVKVRPANAHGDLEF